MNVTEFVIVAVLFTAVSVVGFLAGRGFRSWISWFVIGGDLYTAYTYVAVPALLFGSGAIGMYALPYVAI